jgi:hypothetical protein
MVSGKGVGSLRHGSGASLEHQPFEVELGDDVQRLEIRELTVVEDLHEGPASVEQTQHAVDLVRDLGQALGELLVVDLEDRLHGRKLLEQASPLVEAPHPLHQQALGRQVDDVLAADVLELDLELAVRPDEQAIDGLLPLEPAELGIDHLAIAKVDGGPLGF